MSIISRHWENQRMLIYCFSISLPSATKCPSYFGSERRWGSKVSSRKKKDCLKVYCSPKQSQRSVDTNSWRSMFASFDARQKDSLASTWYSICSERKQHELKLSSRLKYC